MWIKVLYFINFPVERLIFDLEDKILSVSNGPTDTENHRNTLAI